MGRGTWYGLLVASATLWGGCATPPEQPPPFSDRQAAAVTPTVAALLAGRELPPDQRSTLIASLVALGPAAEPALARQLRNPPGSARLCAAAALTQMGTRRSVPALLDALQGQRGEPTDPDGAEGLICLALGRIGDPRGADFLLHRWDASAGQSLYAPWVEALWLMGEPRAAVPLVQGALDGSRGRTGGTGPPAPNVLARGPLSQIVRRHGWNGVRAALENPDPEIARETAVLLADAADPEIVRVLLRMIAEEKVSYQDMPEGPVSLRASGAVLCRAAVPVPGQPSTAKSVQAAQLLKYLATDPQVLGALRHIPLPQHRNDMDGYGAALAAAEALAEMHPDEAVPILRALLLWDTNTDDRPVTILSAIPGPAATEALVAGLSAPSGWISGPCADALVDRSGREAVALLVGLLGHPDELNPSCDFLVHTLWRLRQQELARGHPLQIDWPQVEAQVVARLTAALRKPAQRDGAILALGQCRRDLALPPLLKELEASPDDLPVLLRALGDLQASEAIPWCLQAIRQNPDTWKRRAALRFLAQIHAPQTVGLCQAALENRGPLQISAAWILVELHHTGARARVLDVLQQANARPATDDQALALARYLGPARTLELLPQALERDAWPGWSRRVVGALVDQYPHACGPLVKKDLELLTRVHGGEQVVRDRAAVAALLGRLRTPETVAILAGELDGRGPYGLPAEAAFAALGDIGTPEAMAILKTAARSDHILAVAPLLRLRQPDTFQIIVRMGPMTLAEVPAPVLLEAMRLSGSLPGACDQLAGMLARNLHVPLWQPFLGGARQMARPLEQLTALDLAGDPRGAELLGEIIAPEPRAVEVYVHLPDAVARLGTMRHPRAAVILRSLLSDPRRSVRIQAAEALARRRDRAAIPLLQEMLRHPDAILQFAASKALRRISGSPAGRGPERNAPQDGF